MPEYGQCEDCGRTLQISPRGELQGVACPDCGGQRFFRMQPNPVQSDGAIRNQVNMDTGKDEGGNPDGEGILAPPGGGSQILAAFLGTTYGEHPEDVGSIRTCQHCGWNTKGLEPNCPKCHWPFEADPSSGNPAELRPEIAGAPLTEGTIMQTDHTDPFDTGAHGRDEYTHSHVLAEIVENMPGFKENDPYHNCPECGHDIPQPYDTMDWSHLKCPHCKLTYDPKEWEGVTQGLEQIPALNHPDPWMDNEPGSLTIPKGPTHTWSFVRQAAEPDSRWVESEAFKLIAQNPGIRLPQIAEKLGVMQNVLYRLLPKMEKDTQIVRPSEDPKGFYTLEHAWGQAYPDLQGKVSPQISPGAEIHGDEGYIPQYIMPGQGKNPGPNSWSRYPIPLVPTELEHMDLGPIHQGKVAAKGEHQGYTNWETWHTKLMMDNERHLHEMQKRMHAEGWSPEQIRDWTTEHVIGPENKRKLEDAREWNEIPEPERTDPHYEEMVEKHGPAFKDLADTCLVAPVRVIVLLT